MAKTNVVITNWKTLVDQFGLDDTYIGLKSDDKKNIMR